MNTTKWTVSGKGEAVFPSKEHVGAVIRKGGEKTPRGALVLNIYSLNE